MVSLWHDSLALALWWGASMWRCFKSRGEHTNMQLRGICRQHQCAGIFRASPSYTKHDFVSFTCVILKSVQRYPHFSLDFIKCPLSKAIAVQCVTMDEQPSTFCSTRLMVRKLVHLHTNMYAYCATYACQTYAYTHTQCIPRAYKHSKGICAHSHGRHEWRKHVFTHGLSHALKLVNGGLLNWKMAVPLWAKQTDDKAFVKYRVLLGLLYTVYCM